MNIPPRKRLIAVVTAILLAALAYFAADISFYTFRDPLERASLQSINDDIPLSFTYSSDAVTLHGADQATVYGLTLSGMAVIPDGQASSFPADSLGTLAAVREPYTADTNGDGIDETVVDAAKTDLEFTQEYTAGGNTFLDNRLPFEATIIDRSGFSFTLNGMPLVNAEITAELADGRRAVENYCAVILESDKFNKCYQSTYCKDSQVIKPISGGFFGIDPRRATGPKHTGLHQNKQWDSNIVFLVNKL